VTCNLTLERQIVYYNTSDISVPTLQEWWQITQLPNSNENRAKSLFTASGLQYVSISAQIPTGLASTLVSAGIIGLCIPFHICVKLSSQGNGYTILFFLTIH
jgi:hypothetical protein